jgi:hypothetical protein
MRQPVLSSMRRGKKPYQESRESTRRSGIEWFFWHVSFVVKRHENNFMKMNISFCASLHSAQLLHSLAVVAAGVALVVRKLKNPKVSRNHEAHKERLKTIIIDADVIEVMWLTTRDLNFEFRICEISHTDTHRLFVNLTEL